MAIVTPLLTSDTFRTWLTRTNTAIDLLNSNTVIAGVNATGTLIQSANTVASAKTKVGGTMLYKDNAGTATLGTDLKIYFTCNGGTNWTEAKEGVKLIQQIVASPSSFSATSSGLAFLLFSRKSAATPATCGDAIDVPLQVAVELSLSAVADVISPPGAKRSTRLP
mgnify:CR=1 FL=1